MYNKFSTINKKIKEFDQSQIAKSKSEIQHFLILELVRMKEHVIAIAERLALIMIKDDNDDEIWDQNKTLWMLYYKLKIIIHAYLEEKNAHKSQIEYHHFC